ncbi:MAG: hypothetical protein PHO94_07270 [Petrimonas sp.]|nr:hypothetical protein [Petrimonas sp.]
MKKLFFTFAFAIASISIFAQAEFTNYVNSMNGYTKGYSNNEIAEMYQYHYGVPQNTLTNLFSGFGNNWGNVALGLELSRVLGIPVPDVLGVYRDGQSNGQAWGVMAKRYGIKPGSPAFHRMKRMMRRSGNTWGGIFDDYGKNKKRDIAKRGGFVLGDDMIYGNNGNGRGNSMMKEKGNGNGNGQGNANQMNGKGKSGNNGKANSNKGKGRDK